MLEDHDGKAVEVGEVGVLVVPNADEGFGTFHERPLF
jgi:hypothetical protein